MKLKRYLYIFSYIFFIIIISIINSFSTMDLLEKRINTALVSNPLIFLILDFMFLKVFMKKLEKETYSTQQKVIRYLKTMNNLFLFFTMTLSTTGNVLVVFINMISNITIVYILRPLTIDPNIINGVEEHFQKYPDNNKVLFFKNKDEMIKRYEPLKEEIIKEEPELTKKTKEEKKDKYTTIIMTIVPIIVISVIIIGSVFSIIETIKTFSRAQYNYFEVTINDQQMNIYYTEDYHKKVIPYIYEQEEGMSFSTDEDDLVIDNYLQKSSSYAISLKEYECRNNEKGHNVRVSCGSGALQEIPTEVKITKNTMKIYYEDELIYNGEYQKDITEYLTKTGNYTFKFNNKRDYVKTEINFQLLIIEE